MSDFLTRVAQSALGRMPVMRVLGTQRYGPSFDMAAPVVEAEAPPQQPVRTSAAAERRVEMQPSAEAPQPIDRAVRSEEPEPLREAPRRANVAPRPAEVSVARTPEAIEPAVAPTHRRGALPQQPSVPHPPSVADQRPASESAHAAAETTSPIDAPLPEPRLSPMRPVLQPIATLAEPVATSLAEPRAETFARPDARPGERPIERSIERPIEPPSRQPSELSIEQPNAQSIAPRERSSSSLAPPRERRETIRNVEVAAPPARETRAETPPAPVIHVTIGRVEVRAAAPPPPPPVEAPRPAAPRVSLDDYLRSYGRSR